MTEESVVDAARRYAQDEYDAGAREHAQHILGVTTGDRTALIAALAYLDLAGGKEGTPYLSPDTQHVLADAALLLFIGDDEVERLHTATAAYFA